MKNTQNPTLSNIDHSQKSKTHRQKFKHIRSNLITLTQILSDALRSLNWKYENYFSANLKSYFKK